jgi:hypothetical protein
MAHHPAVAGSVIALVLCGLPLAVHADAYDVQAAKARAATGSLVVKCSPGGGGDTVSVAEALRLLKPGCVLQLYPGHYDSALIISTDKVIIEGGTPRGYCEATIELSGKNCIIRNLWANQLELNRDAIVVDSVFNYVQTSYDQAKTECVLYNSCCRAIYLGDNRNTLAIIGSTVRQSAGSCFAIASWRGGTFKFRDSVISAKHIAFRIAGNPKIEIDNCLIFGDAGLAKEDTFNAKKKGAVAMDLAGFKKLAKCRAKGELIADLPKFKRPSRFSHDIGYSDLNGRRSYWTDSSEEAPDFYLLADDSPGKNRGLGATLDDHGFPISPGPGDGGKAP